MGNAEEAKEITEHANGDSSSEESDKDSDNDESNLVLIRRPNYSDEDVNMSPDEQSDEEDSSES